MTHGPLPRWAQREQGLGYCSVALHLAFICRHNVHDRAPRTVRPSPVGVLGVEGSGDIFEGIAIAEGTRWRGIEIVCVYETERSIEIRGSVV